MDLKDMILVTENDRGTETNMLMTLDDYKSFIAIDDMSELADNLLQLGRTLGEADNFTEYYRAANVTVSARFCLDDIQLGHFLQGFYNDSKEFRFDKEASSYECVAKLKEIGMTDKGWVDDFNLHYEMENRSFERGQTFHNFNDHDYMVLEALSPRNLVVMDMKSGSLTIALGATEYKRYPKDEKPTKDNNKSQIARELEVDRRTVDKYINGYTKPETRNCDDCITPFYDIITELLSDKNQQVFYYRKVLWQYLVDNHGFKGVYCNFCHYLRKYPEFDSYFRKSRPSNTNKVTVRYETPMGKQAQLDWKESIPFILSSGEIIEVNIFVLLLSYSRFRVYRVSLSKTQDILFSFLDDAFETLGGIPDEIVTDNMKTVMDEARTEYYAGKVNNKFQQFADDYGFKVQPCIAGHPHTKAKVEAPMKILDEIRAYNGKLNYIELVELVTRINNRVNTQVNQGTGRIPLMYYNKEKAFLNSLPADNIRKPYQITTNTVKVNHSSMFNYKSCQYSVPPEYIDKIVSLQVYDGYIHVYCNTEFITIHQLSSKKLNYISGHYAAIARKSHIFRDEHIMDRAKENLEIIGKVYDYE